ncbi:MCE family protein [Jatrophihabitans endophyticus]|uniref:MCE family protein n=1 Tax=Jatrophihabitans endophyticus TaxID=1206085 RepID=UPI0019F8EDE4|nr:MCE family protein [Jatrophihabitans endophyticus]MBE7190154.1 MCE family protein [Jatrophihabitans endophyticus]
MKAFSERNPIVIAVVGIVAVVVVAVATFYSEDLPVVGGGGLYAANFHNASGLTSGDDVTVAGVRVGSVASVSLVRKHVHVTFRVKNAWIGDASTAHIDIASLLGEEYIDIDPIGSHALSRSTTIPLKRTTTPIDAAAAFNGLGRRVGKIDTAQLAKSFDTLTTTFRHTPAAFRSALGGLSRISHTIASRDAQLHKLAGNTAAVTKTLSSNNANIAALVHDGSLLLRVLRQRSAAITALLQGTSRLSRQISGLVHDNDKTLGPALQKLSRVTKILSSNRSNIDDALRLIGPYYSLLDDSTGSGRWVDIYLCGLFTKSGAPELHARAKRNCQPASGS